MKKIIKTTGMALMLLMAGALTLIAQQNMRRMKMDTTRMNRMMMNREMPLMMNSDSMPMKGMGHGMRPDIMQHGMRGTGRGRMMGGMCQCPMMNDKMHQDKGMQHGDMSMGPWMHGRMNPGMIIDNIPNLTDQQKKDIAVMRIDQQTEMKKLAEDMQSKIKAMRETHRAAIEKILTPEQKKWFDENTPKPQAPDKPEAVPAKTK
jgi:hypothetical protein